MKKQYKLKKSELKNIINQGWDQRRKNSKVRSEKNSRASANWQSKEKMSTYKNDLHMETVRRFRHYLGNGPVRNM